MNRATWRWLIVLALALLVGGSVPWFAHRHQQKAMRAAVRAKSKQKPALFKRPADPVLVRGGLPSIARKLSSGGALKIVFIGGSITKNAGRGGFVSDIPAWFEERAPGLSIETTNAGIGGTGSDVGAERAGRDVLAHDPDLVFVEFAVNDGDRECTADMERLVRQIRGANPETEIAFIYTVTDQTLPMLERGRFPPSVCRHEAVAEHYAIPTIALGFEAARKIRDGEWTWKDFSFDVCHPTAEGYASYNRELRAALPKLLAAGVPGPKQLPPPMTLPVSPARSPALK